MGTQLGCVNEKRCAHVAHRFFFRGRVRDVASRTQSAVSAPRAACRHDARPDANTGVRHAAYAFESPRAIAK